MELEQEEIQSLEEVGLTPEDAEVEFFDPAECLTSPEAIAVWLDEAVATGNPKCVAYSLGLIAKAVGSGQVTGLSGVKRQALSRALSDARAPHIETLFAVLDALGLRMRINQKPAH